MYPTETFPHKERFEPPDQTEKPMSTFPLKHPFGLSLILTAFFSVIFLMVSGLAQSFGSSIASPPSIRWESDLNAAIARAEQEQRPLFLHFTGNEGLPAQQMASEVFVQPNIVAHLNAHFVMVRINASENAALAQRFSVTAIPTDLVLKPNGQLIYRRTGGITADRFADYLTFLQTKIQSDINSTVVQSSPVLGATANPPGAFAPTPPPAAVPPQREAISIPTTIRDPFMPQQPHVVQQPPMIAGTIPPPPANNPIRTAETPTQSMAEPTVNPPQYFSPGVIASPATASAPPFSVALAEEPAPAKMTVEVPLALEGFCPVTLCSEERWIAGNPMYCTMYQGHIFRFATSEALVAFARNPANYIPVAMGEDIVLMVDRNKRVNGNRKFGAWFQERVFLFSCQETLDTFAARPEYYTEIALKYELARKEQLTQVVY